jgi:hypothetical protein
VERLAFQCGGFKCSYSGRPFREPLKNFDSYYTSVYLCVLCGEFLDENFTAKDAEDAEVSFSEVP